MATRAATGTTLTAFGLRIPFSWAMLFGSTWMMLGLFVDGWAHRHVPGLETFFTPWHAVLYSGLAATTSILVWAFVAGLRRGRAAKDALPRGYFVSMIGALIFGFFGFGDMLWHLAFGIEESVDALLSPAHLGLALGFLLILSGPLRAEPRAGERRRSFITTLPPVITTAYVVAVLGFFTQYAHPLVENFASVGVSEASSGGAIHLHQAGTNAFSRITTGIDGAHGRPEISPDGRTIAFSAAPSDQHDLYLLDRASGEVRQLTTDPRNDLHPAWSPDGSALAWIAADEHFGDLLIRPDGGATSTLVHDIVDTYGTLAWRPDGSEIMFTGWIDGAHRLFVADASSVSFRRLFEVPVTHEELQGSWSPDGRRIAFASVGHGTGDVYVVDADAASNPRLITAPDTLESHPSWLPSGEAISFTVRHGDTANIHVHDLAESTTVNLTQNPGAQDTQGSWSHDGAWLAYVSSAATPTLGGFPVSMLFHGLGVASILLQMILLTTGVLFALSRYRAGVGSVTLMMTAYGGLFAILSADAVMLSICVVSGLVGDLMLWIHRRRGTESPYPRTLAWAWPASFVAAYFAAVHVLGEGIAWPVELWTGSILLAAAIGLGVHGLLVAGMGSRHRRLQS